MITDIVIDPVQGEFDLVEVEHYLAEVPHSARDAIDPKTFMLAASANMLEDAHEQRELDPSRFSMSIILVSVSSKRIVVAFRSDLVGPGRRFVAWLRQRYALKFLDEGLHDITKYVDHELDYLFGASRS
jgi:hypothetical protein